MVNPKNLPRGKFLPCRMIGAVIVGIALVFWIMFIWYITQPVTLTIITETYAVAEDMSCNNTYVDTGVTILTWIEYWWGPLSVIAIGVLWLFISAHRRDWESRWD